VLDFLLGALIVALAIRGWWRGLLREAIALAVMVVGLVLSFRLSTPVGDVVESLAGVSPEAGRLIAGVVIFLGISIGAAIASSILHKGLRFVPGLPTLNRAAGAGFAVVATVAVATLALSLLAVVSPPDPVADQIEGSALAGYLTDPDQVPQKAMGVVSGDRVLERLLSLREMTGTRRLVGDGEVAVLDPVPPDEFRLDRDEEDDVLDMINRERDAAGEDPLVMSEPLSDLARAYGQEVYASGRFTKDGVDGTWLEDRLSAADIPVVSADQVIALAVTSEAAQEAIFSSDADAAILMDPAYRRVGIGVVKGPLGVIVVEVLSG
jgi:uncharacterized protein YkwD